MQFLKKYIYQKPSSGDKLNRALYFKLCILLLTYLDIIFGKINNFKKIIEPLPFNRWFLLNYLGVPRAHKQRLYNLL